MAEAVEPALTPEERAALATGLAQFNDRLFFECHDTLEEAWSGMRGGARDFFQGLIQASVGFYHLGNGNRAGAASVMGRALARLEPYPARYAGVELEPLRASLRAFILGLQTGELPPEPPRVEAQIGAGA